MAWIGERGKQAQEPARCQQAPRTFDRSIASRRACEHEHAQLLVRTHRHVVDVFDCSRARPLPRASATMATFAAEGAPRSQPPTRFLGALRSSLRSLALTRIPSPSQ